MYGATNRRTALGLASPPQELAFSPRKTVDRVVDSHPADPGSEADAASDAIRKAALDELAKLGLTERTAAEPLQELGRMGLLPLGGEDPRPVDELQRLSLTNRNGSN